MKSKELEVLDAVLPATNREEDIDSDYEYTRDNLKSLIDKGTEALDGILELAKESDHPRAYEVVGQIIKTVSDTNNDLIFTVNSGSIVTKTDFDLLYVTICDMFSLSTFTNLTFPSDLLNSCLIFFLFTTSLQNFSSFSFFNNECLSSFIIDKNIFPLSEITATNRIFLFSLNILVTIS